MGAALVALAAPITSAAASPAAPAGHAAVGGAAGSLVYDKGGSVYVAHIDGSHAAVVKSGKYFRWPSMDDNGVVAAEKPDGTTAPDGLTAGWSIYRYTQGGTQLSRVRTPVDFSTDNCPTYPSNHVTLSPDGTKVAYDYLNYCVDGEDTTWTPSSGTMTLHDLGDYVAPSWVNSSEMLVSHFGQTLTTDQAEIGFYLTNNTTAGWSTSIADDWATAYHATTTRDGTKLALIEDDAADYVDGIPRHVKLVLATAPGVGETLTRQCSISLPTTQYDATNWGGATYASLSFSPNGNVLVWDAENGLWKGSTKTLTGCTATSVNKKLWIKGALDGFFSPAADTR